MVSSFHRQLRPGPERYRTNHYTYGPSHDRASQRAAWSICRNIHLGLGRPLS